MRFLQECVCIWGSKNSRDRSNKGLSYCIFIYMDGPIQGGEATNSFQGKAQPPCQAQKKGLNN